MSRPRFGIQGIIVNHKKIMRLMNEHDLQPQTRRRFARQRPTAITTGRYSPTSPRDIDRQRPNQLWVADITYVAIAIGFVYLAVILDAWSRRVIGYAIGQRIDARLALAALRAGDRGRADRHQGASITPIAVRSTPPSDYRAELAKHGLMGSMGRRGNPYDNAKAESFIKTLKVEEVYPMEYETFEDVADRFMSAFDRRVDPEVREVRRLEVITGALGRRRWSAEAKARIVAESLAPGW